MLGAIIALTGLVLVWGYVLYKINKNTNWTQLRNSLGMEGVSLHEREVE